jgi:hypothetical protein
VRFLTLALALPLLALDAGTARAAAAAEIARTAAPAGTERRQAGTEILITRYGTSHETVNVLTVEPSLEVRLGERLAFSGVAPVSTSFMDKNACCGYSLGNLTGGARYRITRDRAAVDLLASVSAPTAPGDGDGGVNSRYAATAAVTRDAGFYLPDVITARLGARTHLPIGERLWLGAGAGIHGWIARHPGQSSQVVLPVTLSAGYGLSRRVFSTAAFTTVFNPAHHHERFVHATDVGLGYAGQRFAVGAHLHLPLDQSLRDLGMVGVGTNLQASF